ncbi:MAG: TadE/TadG family type IV pilus assembly protein [Desulfuromonadaceae bacterium]|nr:TadE/TadG family type IV pilus assembly protein [Desulfuromonadaceae bacterium]
MKNQKGQALVEFAIILPLLFLLIFGIFEFGRAMYIKNSLNNAARSAVRVAVVTPNLTAITYSAGQLSTQSSTDKIQAKIYDNLLYINKATATATVTIVGNSPAQPGDTVTVAVTADFNSIVSKITDTLQINVPDTLSGEASMRYE